MGGIKVNQYDLKDKYLNAKACTKCHTVKFFSEFRNDKYTKSGKTTRCKTCLKRNSDMPQEARCFYCRDWFIKTQSSYKFCKRICHNRYWDKAWRLSTKGQLYMMEYHRDYDRRRYLEMVKEN